MTPTRQLREFPFISDTRKIVTSCSISLELGRIPVPAPQHFRLCLVPVPEFEVPDIPRNLLSVE